MKNPSRNIRGTVIAYFLVMVSVLVTGLLTTMALSTGTESQIAGQTAKRDQAFYAAEAGVQHAFWMLQQNSSWRADAAHPVTATLGNATYSVTCVGGWNSPVLIVSEGMLNNGATCVTVTAAASPKVIVPAITLGSNFDNAGNATITGDVATVGNINTTGSLTEKGSLYSAGAITTMGSVAVLGTSNPNYIGPPAITVPTVDIAALKAAAFLTINVPSGGGGGNYNVPTLDFTSHPNGDGIIYFKGGPIIFRGNQIIKGAGTIVTDDDVTIQAAASVGTSAQPANLNIVVGGNLIIQGYLGLIGSIYVPNGSITKTGGLDITGVIVGGHDLTTNGGLNITIAQPPPWDPRNSMPGIMVLSRVTGPIF